MRGAARIGGKSFKIPKGNAGSESFNPFEALDLPVAPRLEPINDEWSWSVGAEPADPRDCARYPASPYCGELPLSLTPIGYEPEIKTNGRETCLYIYPVIAFLKMTPQVICHREPSIPQSRILNQDLITKSKPPRYPEKVFPNKYKSEFCAMRESILNIFVNWSNDVKEREIKKYIQELQENEATILIEQGEISESGGYPNPCAYQLSYPVQVELNGPIVYFTLEDRTKSTGIRISWKKNGYSDYRTYDFMEWTVGSCCGMPKAPQPPPIIPPPPEPIENRNTGRNRGNGYPRRDKDMCCNDCAEAKDNTARLLKEIKEIKKTLGTGKLAKAVDAAVGIGDESVTALLNLLARRLGTDSYPIEVPESLLSGTSEGKIFKAQSNAEYLFWLTKQIDALVGEFPIDIKIEDIDPLKEGNQTKIIKLPNVAEAIAELYGLTMKSSVNQEVELNMLLRLAAEAIATKNAAVVTQDYARANAIFLGYKGNFKPRELQYNFDFAHANLDPRSKEPIVLEKLLKTVTGFVQGWQIEDKETVVGFLQKLMFSAGIIKAVFFRGKKQQKELNREMTSMAEDEKIQESKFEAFIKEINDPNSRFNRDSPDKPIAKDITTPEK